MSSKVQSTTATAIIRSVGSLSRMMKREDDPELMAIFQAHCDESGKLADSDCVVFAAAVATDDSWQVLSRKWSEILPADIPYVHMKEAMRFDGPFTRWKERRDDRDGLLEALAEMSIDLIAFHTQSPMNTADFRTKVPQAAQERLRDVWYCGFETLMKSIAGDSVSKDPNHRFHLFCDLTTDYAERALKLYMRMRMHQVYRNLFPSLTFADDTEFPPLQVADMLAYVRKQEYTRGLSACEPIIGKLAGIFRKFQKDPRMSYVSYPKGSALGDGVLE